MTQYLDLPSWAAAQMIWALFPWVWWGLRRTMLRGANPLPALAAGYLLVTVGYVFGTIMLVVAIVACLVDGLLARDRGAVLRVLGAGVLLGLVAVTVYLPGVLTASVTARETGYGGFGGKFTTDPLALFASVLPTAAVTGTSAHVLPYAYLFCLLPVFCWMDLRRAREGWRPLAGLLLFTVVVLAIVDGPSQVGPLRWPLRLQPFLVQALAVLLVVAWTRFGLARPSPLRLGLSLGWVVLAGALTIMRTSSDRAGDLCSVALVAAALTLLWWLVRSGRRAWLAPVAGAVTLAAFGVQHAFYPTPPSPQRNAPTDLAAYQSLYPGGHRRPAQGGCDGPARAVGPGRGPAAADRVGVVPHRPHGAEHLHGHQPGRVQGPLLHLLPGRHLSRAAPRAVQHRTHHGGEAGRPAGRELAAPGAPRLQHGAADPSAGGVASRRAHAVRRPVDAAYAAARGRRAWPGRRRAPRSRRSTPGRPVRRSAWTGCRLRAGPWCCGCSTGPATRPRPDRSGIRSTATC